MPKIIPISYKILRRVFEKEGFIKHQIKGFPRSA